MKHFSFSLVVVSLLCLRVTADDVISEYLATARAVSLDKARSGVLSVPAQEYLYLERVSPNGTYIALCQIHKGDRAKHPGKVVILKTSDLQAVQRFSALKGRTYVLFPSQTRWAPDSRALWIRMRYADIPYGEWMEYDLQKSRFTAASQKRLKELLAYSKGTRPKGFRLDPRTSPMAPVWTTTGIRVSDPKKRHKLDPALVWNPPNFLGESRQSFYIGETLVKVLVEHAPGHKLETGETAFGLFVFRTGRKVRKRGILNVVTHPPVLTKTLSSASPFMPSNGLLLRKQGQLVLYRNLGGAEPLERIDLKGYDYLKMFSLGNQLILKMAKGDKTIAYLAFP